MSDVRGVKGTVACRARYGELKRDLRRAGFDERPGKGSHTVWRHRLLPDDPWTVSGNDGDDAPLYHELADLALVRKVRAAAAEETRRRGGDDDGR